MPLLEKSNELLTFNFFWAFPASWRAALSVLSFFALRSKKVCHCNR
jgi:hypothetical protein